MGLFRYLKGDTQQFGYTFTAGEWTEVPESNVYACGKLRYMTGYYEERLSPEKEAVALPLPPNYGYDEPQEAEESTPRKRGGWPKGKARKVQP